MSIGELSPEPSGAADFRLGYLHLRTEYSIKKFGIISKGYFQPVSISAEFVPFLSFHFFLYFWTFLKFAK